MKRLESFQTARHRRQRLFRSIQFLIIFFILFQFIDTYLVTSVAAVSVTMEPSIHPGDRLVVLPSAYGLERLFARGKIAVRSPMRGDVVLIRPPSSEPVPWVRAAVINVSDFLTLRSIKSLANAIGPKLIKRVVALPGDSVRMNDFIIQVRVAGTGHYLTEYEVSGLSYDILTKRLPDGWTDELPLSGTFPDKQLGPDEYFVIGDDRLSFSDSRLFGPISADHILGKVAFCYWPFKRQPFN